GVILYEMLGGRRPHDGDRHDAVLFSILRRAPVPLERLREGLPAGLAAVIERAMAFAARDRYASAAELAAALAPFAARGRAGARRRPLGPVRTATAAAAAAAVAVVALLSWSRADGQRAPAVAPPAVATAPAPTSASPAPPAVATAPAPTS